MTRSLSVHRLVCRTVLLAAACVSVARGVGASPSSKLVYIRGAGADACPGEDDLRKAVAARLGYDPFFPSAQKTVVAEVARTPSGYRGKVQIVGDSGALRGARELATKGDDCAELVSTMALAISIAIDDLDAEERARAPEAPDEPAPPASAEVAPVLLEAAPAETRPPEAPKKAPAIRGDFGASVGPTASFGVAPAPAVGASLAAVLGYGRFAVRGSFRADLAASAAFAPVGRVSGHSFVGTLEGCVRSELPFVCAGGGLGSIATETSGITRGASDDGLLAIVVGTVGARVRLGTAVYLEPFATGVVELIDQDVRVDGRSVFSLPRIGGTLGLHLGWQIF